MSEVPLYHLKDDLQNPFWFRIPWFGVSGSEYPGSGSPMNEPFAFFSLYQPYTLN